MTEQQPLPNHSEIIVIGGGVIGISVAYHLALAGKRDVIVLEKAALTHGCTWHAAGLVGQLRNKLGLTRLMQYSTELFGQLEQETGLSPGWNPVGSLRIASSRDRWLEVQHSALKARSFGVDLHLVDAHEAVNLFPLMDPGDIFGAAYLPDDGYVDPYGVTQSMAKGFRQLGGCIFENVAVSGLQRKNRRIFAVQVGEHTIECETVVNCAGLWARQVGELADVSVPAGIVEHQYLITEKSSQINDHLPTFRDPDRNFYLKVEAGGFEFGGWEDDSVAVSSSDFPANFTRTLYASNFDRFAQIFENAAKRLPIINEFGVHSLINGPIPVSADGEPIMGRVCGLDNFYVACGFTAGIACSGGAGRAMAEWIVDGQPSLDLWNFDVRRFGVFHSHSPYLERRALLSYGRYYKIHWPHEEPNAGERLRCSPLYAELKDNGAIYGSKFGWERPNWFSLSANNKTDVPTFEKPNWFASVAKECESIRTAVALIDQSSFFKVELSGSDALQILDNLATCSIDRPVGSVIYAQMCNARGGIECDVVIMRVGVERFWLYTGSGFGVHDLDWIERHASDDGNVVIKDITDAYAVINICGPRSRDVLAKVAKCEVSRSAFPYMTCKTTLIDDAQVLLARVEYSGELGWEITVKNIDALNVYRRLREAGEAYQIVDAGYRALDSLRLENGYLYWSGEISPYVNPYEVGLDPRISSTKMSFVGKEALQQIALQDQVRRLYCFHTEQYVPIFGGEPIVIDDQTITHTLSGGYGHTVDRTICYAFLEKAHHFRNDFYLQTIDRKVTVEKQLSPLYRRGKSDLN